METQWKIRISPKTSPTQQNNNQSIITTWAPNLSNNQMLMYNPTIGLLIRNRKDTKNYIIVPIHMIYLFINSLIVVNNNLDKNKIYREEDNHLYLDTAKVIDSSVKMSCFSDSIIISPSIMELNQQDIKAVQIKHNSTIMPIIGNLTHRELHQLIETLRHMDFQTYSIVLALMERIVIMDQKIDTIMETQKEILGLLKGEGIKSNKVSIKTNNPISDFTWEGVSDAWELAD